MIRFLTPFILSICLLSCTKKNDVSNGVEPPKERVEEPANQNTKNEIQKPKVELSHPKSCDVYAPKCAETEFCDAGLGACQTKGATGICKPKPEVCATILLPVCGCDGKSYSNECSAHKEGIAVMSKGECAN